MAGMVLAGWVLAAAGLVMAGAVRLRWARRSEALARACHEIRGPLGAARLAVLLGARRGALTPAQLRALDLELERAGLALADLDRARTGRRDPGWGMRQDVPIRDLLVDSVAAWQASAAMRGTQLALRWSGPETTVWAQRARLAQAIENLIANALEHGAGPVEVRGSCAGNSAIPTGNSASPTGDSGSCTENSATSGGDTVASGGDSVTCDGDSVRIEVLDAGAGLNAPVAELVSQANRSRRWPGAVRRRRGARADRGRGLAIARQVAAAHGGRLSSAPSERGARLVLTLPVRPTAGLARGQQA